MYAQAEKQHESSSRAAAISVAQKTVKVQRNLRFSDNRLEAITQKKLDNHTSKKPIQRAPEPGTLVTDGKKYYEADGTEQKGEQVPGSYQNSLKPLGADISNSIYEYVSTNVDSVERAGAVIGDIKSLVGEMISNSWTDDLARSLNIDKNSMLNAANNSIIPAIINAIKNTYDHSNVSESFFAQDGKTLKDKEGSQKYLKNKIFGCNNSIYSHLREDWEQSHPNTIGAMERTQGKHRIRLSVTGFVEVENKKNLEELEQSLLEGYAKVGGISKNLAELQAGIKEKKLDFEITEYKMDDKSGQFLLYRSDTRGDEIFKTGFTPRDESLGGPIFRASKMDIDPQSAVCASLDPAACAVFPIHTDSPKVDFIPKTKVWAFIASDVFPTLLVQAAHFGGKQESAKFNLYAEEVALNKVIACNILGYVSVTRNANGNSYPLGYAYTEKTITVNPNFQDQRFAGEHLNKVCTQIGDASPIDPQILDETKFTKNLTTLRYEIIKSRQNGYEPSEKVAAYKKSVTNEKFEDLNRQVCPVTSSSQVIANRGDDSNAERKEETMTGDLFK